MRDTCGDKRNVLFSRPPCVSENFGKHCCAQGLDPRAGTAAP